MDTGFLAPLGRLAALIAIVIAGGAQDSAARLASVSPATGGGSGAAPGPALTLSITPHTSTALAGRAQHYSVRAFDAYGNAVDMAGAPARLTIDPDGRCDGLVCMARKPGPHTVTGSFGAAYGTAVLSVMSLAPKLTLKVGRSGAVAIDSESGRGRLDANCPVPRGEVCRVSGRLVTPVGERLITAGMLSGSLRASRAGKLTIKLSRTGLARLRRHSGLTAIGALRVIDVSGRASLVVTLTLRPAGHI
jgi:hypothetical protein